MSSPTSRVRVHDVAVSLDGFATGEGRSLEAPSGHAGQRLPDWAFGTRTFQTPVGASGGGVGVDEVFASGWNASTGAEIVGRGESGPHHGPWSDHEWRGWWGEDPPFHTPVFVLTHHPLPSLEMEGGTTFHVVDATPAEALALARDAANGQDVPHRRRRHHGPGVPRGGPRRPPARRRRPDRPRSRGPAVGRARRRRSASTSRPPRPPAVSPT